MTFTASKPARDARGYGRAHEAERRRWKRVVEAGEAFCTRCGLPVTGAFHLDHSDDRTEYLGVAHPSCNMSAGGRKGQAASAAVRRRKRRKRNPRTVVWAFDEPWSFWT